MIDRADVVWAVLDSKDLRIIFRDGYRKAAARPELGSRLPNTRRDRDREG
jgi:hypothetical protein